MNGKEGGILVQALHQESISEIQHLVMLERDFHADPLMAETGKHAVTIRRWCAHSLTRMQHFVRAYKHSNNNLYPVWLKLNTETLEQFANLTLPTLTNPKVAGTSNTATPAQLFKKGIRCDPTVFPVLKAQKHFLSWRRKFDSKAHAQDLAHVLDSKLQTLDCGRLGAVPTAPDMHVRWG